MMTIQKRSLPAASSIFICRLFLHVWWHGKQNLFPCTYLTSRQIELSEYGNVCPLSFETNGGDEWYLRRFKQRKRALNFLSHFTFFYNTRLLLCLVFTHSNCPSFFCHSLLWSHQHPPAWMKNVFIYWKEVGTKIYYVAYFNILWRNIL